MKILAIETSCDETAAAVTRGTQILASVKWTQEVHARFGGVVPSLAKRAHEERIESIINQAMSNAKSTKDDIGAIAVTVGPGLAMALEVGIKWAKKLAQEWHKPLIGVNHIEGHILSVLASISPSSVPPLKFSPLARGFAVRGGIKEGDISFPCLALVISGGHTQIIRVDEIGKYKVLAQSLDDDIGEALDKGARMLGLPYPGGPALEKLAAMGNPKKYKLPLPMAGREGKAFSYSGLKTAMFRLVTKLQSDKVTEQMVCDLAASYQAMVFKHLVRTLEKSIRVEEYKSVRDLLVGGGVAANQTLRQELGIMNRELGLRIHYPENLMLCTDNAAMVGVAAGFKAAKGEFSNPEKIDRLPRWRVDEK